MKKLYIQTYGCQMNDHDSERMAGLLAPEGYTLSERMDEADLILMNTCSIRDKAEQKAYSDLGRVEQVRRHRPELIVGVAGCMARQEGSRILKRLPWVRLVFGSKQIDQLPHLLQETLRSGRPVVAIDDPVGMAPSIPAKRNHSVRAWVSIMEGCENRCTFCVVPHTRGRERSRWSQEIVSEVKALVADGCREVTLLGQNVNSYGRTSEEGVDLPDLLRMVDQIEGLERVRFTTSHPNAITDKLIGAMAELSTVCEHLHLPMQSGSDRVLSRMNREYTRSDYRERVSSLREAVPGVALTTDIIVGFPGETDDDFNQTLESIEEFNFANLFAFKYSPRPNTRAQDLDGRVDEPAKQRRFQQLMEVQGHVSLKRRQSFLGSRQELLFDGQSRSRSGWLVGKTRTSEQVHVPVSESISERMIGRLAPVVITTLRAHALEGELL